MLKSSQTRRLNRRFLLILCIPLLCVAAVVINMVYNNIRNQQYANLLYQYPLPPETEKLSQETECFCPPNGGTCALVFSETLLTSLNEEQVKAYYEDVWFPPLRKKSILEEYNRAHVELDFSNAQQTNERIQFKVSIGESFYDGGLFDRRCAQ